MSLQTINKQSTILLAFLLACNHSGPPARKSDAPVIAALPTKVLTESTIQTISIQELANDETYSGAGTGFQLASAPPDSSKVVFGYADPEEPSNMRINNQLVALKHVGSKVIKAGKGRQGLGEHVQDRWANETYTVVFDYTTTVVGEGGVGYEGKVTIQSGSQKAVFPITGGSGC